jgi:hypothetical protein
MPTFDNFHDYSAGLTGPICGGFTIAPDDATDVAQVTRAIMVSVAGNVSVVLKSGDTVTLPKLDTGTTATGITGLV